MNDWHIVSTVHYDEHATQESFTYAWQRWVRDDRYPVRQTDTHSAWLGDKLIWNAQAGIIDWIWQPVFLRFAGLVWLCGPYCPMRSGRQVWPANPLTVWPWLWSWVCVGKEDATYALVTWLERQGVLVIGEMEKFQFWHLFRYLLRPGHREQRRAFRRMSR